MKMFLPTLFQWTYFSTLFFNQILMSVRKVIYVQDSQTARISQGHISVSARPGLLVTETNVKVCT